MTLKTHQHLKQLAPKEEWARLGWVSSDLLSLPHFFALWMRVTRVWLNFFSFSFSGCSVLGTCPEDKTPGERDGRWASYPLGGLGWGKAEGCGSGYQEEDLYLWYESGIVYSWEAEPSSEGRPWHRCVWYKKGNSWFRESKRERTLKHTYLSI